MGYRKTSKKQRVLKYFKLIMKFKVKDKFEIYRNPLRIKLLQ